MKTANCKQHFVLFNAFGADSLLELGTWAYYISAYGPEFVVRIKEIE